MTISRRTLSFLGLALIASAAPAAFAQQNYLPSSPSTLPPSVPPGAYREWPGTASQATRPQAAAVADDGDMIDSQGGGAIPSLPLEPQTVGSITYITGGIGDEELAQLRSVEPDYNFHLLMNAPGGAFIGDVSLKIADSTGKELLAIEGAGPYFYAKLPAGNYSLDLNGEGEDKKVSVKIGAKGSVKKLVQFKEAGGVITPHAPTASVDKP